MSNVRSLYLMKFTHHIKIFFHILMYSWKKICNKKKECTQYWKVEEGNKNNNAWGKTKTYCENNSQIHFRSGESIFRVVGFFKKKQTKIMKRRKMIEYGWRIVFHVNHEKKYTQFFFRWKSYSDFTIEANTNKTSYWILWFYLVGCYFISFFVCFSLFLQWPCQQQPLWVNSKLEQLSHWTIATYFSAHSHVRKHNNKWERFLQIHPFTFRCIVQFFFSMYVYIFHVQIFNYFFLSCIPSNFIASITKF